MVVVAFDRSTAGITPPYNNRNQGGNAEQLPRT